LTSLAHSAARGAFFTFAAQAAKILLQLASVVVLSRLLSPHDYGLLAIVLVVVGLGEIFRDFGLTSASIQATELSRGQRDNLFWINAAIGAALTVLLFLLAEPLAQLTSEPDLVGMTHWLSPLFLLNGLATQHRATLMRSLKFRALAIIDVTAAASALGAAIFAAILGADYWALVIQQLTSGGVVLVGAILADRWLPRWYSRHERVRNLVTFGWNIVATNLLVYAGSQIDTVILGLRYGTTSLGLYNRAFQLVMTPLGQVRAPMKGVALPVLSRVQQDPPRFDLYVSSAQLALGYVLGIPLALVAALSDPVVHIMLGAQWADAAPIISLFATAGLLTTLSFVGYWVYLARGLGRQLFVYTIVTTCIKIGCIAAGSMFGVLGVAIGFTVAPAIAWPLSLFWLSRITPLPTAQLYAGATRVLTVTGTTAVSAWGTTLVTLPLGAVPTLAIGVLTGLLVASAFLLVPLFRNDALKLTDFARLMIRREG